jgi:hypothetical protein
MQEFRIFIIHYSFVFQKSKNSDGLLDNASDTVGECTVIYLFVYFGIFVTVIVFWDWPLFSYFYGKEDVAVKHCTYYG